MEALRYIEENLIIQNKAGELTPLVFNPAQRLLYEEILREQALRQPVRIIILKARQIGFSTATAALFYQRAATCPNTNAMIVAHKADASTNIFNKTKLFYDCSPAGERPLKKASNAKELLFENPSSKAEEKARDPGLRSRIQIETAGNKDAGRSATIHLLHLSELAFWPYAELTMASLMQAVPNLPETMVIIESTANGVGGAFYKEWQRAVQGESAFTPLFFPWWQHGEYRLPEAARDKFAPTPEERELQAIYGLDAAQLAWRRWCISANCAGDEDIFSMEYPAAPEEAFLQSGRPVFNLRLLSQAYAAAGQGERGRVAERAGRAEFCPGEGNFLTVYEKPRSGGDYLIGIDVAAGYKGGDYSAMVVLDKDSGALAAVWHGHMEPDLFGEEAELLGRYYNRALLIPEANNHGIAVLGALKRARYHRVYRRDNGEPGFLTTARSKAEAVAALAAYIRADAVRIRDRETLQECMNYVYDDKGATNAQAGYHDDRVMALALAALALAGRPRGPLIKEEDWREVYGAYDSTGY